MNERNIIAAILAAGMLQGKQPTGQTSVSQLAVMYYMQILSELTRANMPAPLLNP
jgi:hypothetical protein